MTKCGTKAMANTMAGLRISIWSALTAAVFALMTGLSSSVLAEEVSIKGLSSSFSQVPGTVVVVPPTGIPTTHATGGTPPKVKIDLPPGTYTIQFSGTNPNTGKTETGARQVTVVAGQRSSVVVEISEAGTINPPMSSTAANGVTSTGQANISTAARASRFNVSGSAGASATFIPGIDMLAGFNGGNATGVNAVSTDGNNVGSQVGANMRVKMPAPTIGNLGLGAENMYFDFGGQHIWGRSVTRTDRINSNVEVPGLGILNNFLTGSIDNLEARTEYDSLEFAAAVGWVFGLGPMEAYTLGNIFFGSMGNLGGTDGRRGNQVKLSTEAKLLYQRSERNDDIDFTSPGNSNRYRNEITTNKVGVRVGSRISLPVARGVRFKFGGSVGVSRANHDLESTLDRTGTMASAEDSKNTIGYDLGASTSLTAKLGPGRLSAYVNYLYESKTPLVHFQAANSDEHRLGFDSAQQVTTGLKYIVPTSVFSSDAKLKTDIVRLGALPSGLPVYSYKYIWSPETHIGVMAQEALLMYPDAVQEIDGFLAVDYSKIK